MRARITYEETEQQQIFWIDCISQKFSSHVGNCPMNEYQKLLDNYTLQREVHIKNASVA